MKLILSIFVLCLNVANASSDLFCYIQDELHTFSVPTYYGTNSSIEVKVKSSSGVYSTITIGGGLKSYDGENVGSISISSGGLEVTTIDGDAIAKIKDYKGGSISVRCRLDGKPRFELRDIKN